MTRATPKHMVGGARQTGLPPRVAIWLVGGLVGLCVPIALAAPVAATNARAPEVVALQEGIGQICLPLLEGAKIGSIAKAWRLHNADTGWRLDLPAGDRLQVVPPGGANPTVCTLSLTYPVGGQDALLALVDAWSQAHGLHKVAVRAPSTGPYRKRWSSSWQGAAAGGAMAIVFDEQKTLDGEPVAGRFDEASVLVSLKRGVA